VDSNTVTCKIPAENSLVNPAPSVPFALSMNSQIYYPNLVNVDYVKPDDTGAVVTATLIPLVGAVAAASVVAALFVGKPLLNKKISNSYQNWMTAVKEEPGGEFAAKFLQLAMIALILTPLSLLWAIILSSFTAAVYSIIASVFLCLQLAASILGFIAVKGRKPTANFAFRVVMFVATLADFVSIVLLIELGIYYHSAQLGTGVNQSSYVFLDAMLLISLFVLLPLNIAMVLFSHKLHSHLNQNFRIEGRFSHIDYVDVAATEDPGQT